MRSFRSGLCAMDAGWPAYTASAEGASVGARIGKGRVAP